MVEKANRRGMNKPIDSSQPRNLADLHGQDRRAARRMARYMGQAFQSAPQESVLARPDLSGEFKISK